MTAICIASGSSLTQEDVDYCRGKGKVYVVSDCYKLAPWADVLYSCDERWWRHHDGVPDFKGEKWTLDPHAAANHAVNLIGTCEDAWSLNPEAVAKGGSSGFQCLNLAVLQGAKRVILLGYDTKIGADGRRHFFGDHQSDSLNVESEYHLWLLYYQKAAPLIPVPVINCTVDTALDCFPRENLRNALIP